MEVKVDIKSEEIMWAIAQVAKHGTIEEVRMLLPKLQSAVSALNLRLTRDAKMLAQKRNKEKDAWSINNYI
ncbi:MAG: hypothetical protein F6K08_19715 [Okeania sp. SIO1H6]|uniref:hypothetical protein n=1 Tax=Okeania sp. SIO2B3 TaxID=2607784 RepID=UPI0013BF9351|nr:hypothetical protein [Okeania sp. SIO2B3]NET14897.1 hypothetical protein [Okeania sp. SIO1H6]NET45979.1 hypothetical protein [Okeania sp. SIO2B3]